MTEELWASKPLDLCWMPVSPIWHSPQLVTLSSGVFRWFWRVDAVFLAWAHERLQRAMFARATLTPETHAAYRVLCAYLEERSAPVDPWPEVRRLREAGPVTLPAIESDLHDLAAFDVLPRWERWKPTEPGADADAPPVPKPRPAAAPKKPTAKKADDDKPKLF